MASPLHLANYETINNEMSELLGSGKYIGVNLTVYTNPAGTNIAIVNNKSIENLKIVKISSTNPYVDNETGSSVNGTITVDFEDGSHITSTDNVDSFWYTLHGIAFVPKTFGSA